MRVHAVQPSIDAARILAGAQFIDAYSITVAAPVPDARTAAVRTVGAPPGWVNRLMRLRNALVTPFGLKTPRPERSATAGRIGIFPVLAESPDRIVAGLDDAHLDFRVAIDLARMPDGDRVTATTLVRTHNRLGRFYLAAIMPFHRAVVRAMLRQLAETSGDSA